MARRDGGPPTLDEALDEIRERARNANLLAGEPREVKIYWAVSKTTFEVVWDYDSDRDRG